MHIAFFGDSLTEGLSGTSLFPLLETRLPEDRLYNFGRGGDTAVSLYRRISGMTFDRSFSLAFLWVGTNDILARQSHSYALLKLFRRQPWARSEKEFRKVCFQMSVHSLEFGALNEFAYFRQPISWKDYVDPAINRIIAKPLTKFDCSGSYNGAGAVYLIPDQTDIKLTSVKSAFDSIQIAERKTLIYLESAVIAGRNAYQEAKLNPTEIDLCELHDAFKTIPWIAAEDLGFAERGQGHRFVIQESNKERKKVYVNRSGGFLSRTHPLGASGGAQLVELVWQMRGHDQYKEMFGKKTEDLNYGLWFNMSGFGNTSIVGIIERTKPFRSRQGFKAENLPQSIPEDLIVKKKPRKDRVVAATQYKPPGDENEINVAIIQTKEGDFRIGLAKDPQGIKRGKYIKWIQPEDGPYFIKEGYVKGRLSDLFRIFRREKHKEE